MRCFYPFPTGYVFVDVGAEGTAGVFGETRHRWWNDGQTFTIHRTFGNPGQAAPWCPRIDDVKVWSGDELIYTDTYNFYSNAKNLTHLSAPGHIWADRWMKLGEQKSGSYTDEVFLIEHSNCSVTSSSLSFTLTNVALRGLYSGDTAWSPYTGGESNPLPVLRLDEITWFGSDPDDWTKEEWFFYDHPTLGYISIHTKGTRKNLGSSTIETLWDLRLQEVREEL